MGSFIRGRMVYAVRRAGMGSMGLPVCLLSRVAGFSPAMDRMVSPVSPVVGAVVVEEEAPWEAYLIIFVLQRLAIPIALVGVVAVVVKVVRAAPAVKAAVAAEGPSLSSSGITARMGSFGTVLSP